MIFNACDTEGGEEVSVMDIIRNNRDIQGMEFNMENKIDQTPDMFIRKFREGLIQRNMAGFWRIDFYRKFSY